MARLCVTAALLALAFAAAGAAPAAASYHSCNISGQQTTFGPSYVTSLAVRHTSCRTGKRVVRAYHKCRRASGGKTGHCHHRVLHYRCTEKRGYGHGQFTGKVICTRGDRRVRHTYTQFT